MNIEPIDPDNSPRHQERTDYTKLAEEYNRQSVGLGVRFPRVSNITHFKQALKRRGLKEGIDFRATQRGSKGYLQRLSGKTMKP